MVSEIKKKLEEKTNNGVNVYDKVYSKLQNLDDDKLRPYEFYSLVENMKVNGEEIIEVIQEVLYEAGFNKSIIERISNNIAYRVRFTRADARDIEKELCKRGCILRKRNYIFIN